MAASFDSVSAGGITVPLYLLQSDKSGHLTSPEARDDLLARVADGSLRDVYLFAPGWNLLDKFLDDVFLPTHGCKVLKRLCLDHAG